VAERTASLSLWNNLPRLGHALKIAVVRLDWIDQASIPIRLDERPSIWMVRQSGVVRERKSNPNNLLFMETILVHVALFERREW